MVRAIEGVCFDCILFLCIFEVCDRGAVSAGIAELPQQLLKFYENLGERLQWLEDREVYFSFRSQQEPSEGCGRAIERPRYLVSKSQIEGLRELGFSWSKIPRMIGISGMTSHRRRLDLGLDEEQNNNDIEDDVLDVFVRSVIDLSPNSEGVMIRGALRGRGVHVQRWRLRESIGE